MYARLFEMDYFGVIMTVGNTTVVTVCEGGRYGISLHVRGTEYALGAVPDIYRLKDCSVGATWVCSLLLL